MQTGEGVSAGQCVDTGVPEISHTDKIWENYQL